MFELFVIMLLSWCEQNERKKHEKKDGEKKRLANVQQRYCRQLHRKKRVNEWNMCHATKHVTQIVTIYKIHCGMVRTKRSTRTMLHQYSS